MEVAPRGEWSPEALELAQQHHPGRPGSRNMFRKGCTCPECVEANRVSRERDAEREGASRPRSRSGSSSSSGARGKRGRRQENVARTIRDFIALRRPELDTSTMTLLEAIDHDADAWGEAVAWLAELVLPLGVLLDTVFGAPLAVLVKLAPSFRAARRALRDRREARARAAEEAALDAEAEAGGGEGLRVMPGLEGAEAAQQ